MLQNPTQTEHNLQLSITLFIVFITCISNFSQNEKHTCYLAHHSTYLYVIIITKYC